MTRTASLERTTTETSITLRLDLDGAGTYDIATGVGFFDHMLSHIVKQDYSAKLMTAQCGRAYVCASTAHRMVPGGKRLSPLAKETGVATPGGSSRTCLRRAPRCHSGARPSRRSWGSSFRAMDGHAPLKSVEPSVGVIILLPRSPLPLLCEYLPVVLGSHAR